MKTNFLKNIFYSFLAIIFITSCANDDDYSAPNFICEDQTEGLTANISGEDLYAMATASLQEFSPTGDDYIEGYITSSDRGGNFFKTLSFETADGRGMSIAIDVPNTYTKGYQVGRKIFIKLNGLYFHINHSSLAIGEYFVNASGFESAGRIPQNKVGEHIFFTCDFKTEAELVHTVTIAQAKNNNYINKLIKLGDLKEDEEETNPTYLVEFVEAGSTYYDENNVIGGATNRNIRDLFGSTVIFRTGSFATYAGRTIPNKSGEVIGVMTKFNNDFQFVSRDEQDLKLKEEPLGELEPIEPSPDAVGVFPGYDFENWSEFTGGLNVIRNYVTQGVGTGMDGGSSMKIQMASTGSNELAISSYAYADLPENPSKIIFWMKGTSAKTLSVSMFRADNPSQWVAFNLGNVTGTKGITSSGSNSYTGTINTNGEWVQIILDLASAGIDFNVDDFSNVFFGIRVGNNAAYDLEFDNFTIE
ncbi:MAG: DUF5689 domain-containing protein [Flavobacteriaceae bacterium]